MINIRQFNSVNVFMNRVRSLDTVLENIESFSSKVSAERASQEELKASDQQLIEESRQSSELNICCICLDRDIERILTCFHAYCRPCIDDWKQRDPSCPMCRENENGRGSFDLIRRPSNSQHEELKVQLMRELARIIGDLLGQTVEVQDNEDQAEGD